MSKADQAKILLLLLVGGVLVEGQFQTSYATSLYVGFMRTRAVFGVNTLYDPYLLIGTNSQSNVTFTITRADGTEESIGETNSNTPAVLDLSNDLIVLNAENQFRQKGLLVSSSTTTPLSAVAYAYDVQGLTDAFLVLPCHALLIDIDYEYFAVSFQGIETEGYHSQVLLVGCEDGTNVTITPSQNVGIPSDLSAQSTTYFNLSAGQSYSFVLDELQTLLISSTTSDLTGTRIISSKPISVTSGNDCSRIPINSADCEYLVEQIPPIATWGNNFILAPFLGRQTGQFYKVVSSKDSTLVKRTCNNDSITTEFSLMSAGNFEFFYTTASVYCSLESNKPILVVQVALSYDQDNIGDPTMILVAPMDEYLQSFQFQALPTVGSFKHYINVMVPERYYQPSQIYYDGGPSSDCNWRPVTGADRTVFGWGCNYEITPGVTHTVHHTASDGKLFVMVYGFKGQTTTPRAYGYPAGLALDYHVRTVSFTATQYRTTEGSRMLIVGVRYEGITTGPVTVRFLTVDDTSKAGQDYEATDVDVMLTDDETLKNVTIPIIDDNLSESLEKFILRLSPSPNSPNRVSLHPISQAVVTIIDDDDIVLGIANSSTDSNASSLFINVDIIEGLLAPSLSLPISLLVTTPSGLEATTELQFSSYITRFIVHFDLNQLLPTNTAREAIELNATLSSTDTTGINVRLRPSQLMITILPTPTIASSTPPTVTGGTHPALTPFWVAVVVGGSIIIVLIISVIVVAVLCFCYGKKRNEYKPMHKKSNCTSVTVTELPETTDDKALETPLNHYEFWRKDTVV